MIAADEFTNIEVVDGQQRLTTITILLKAISKAASKSDAKLTTLIDSILVKGDNLSLVLLQTNHDSSHIFTDYLREGIIPSEKPKTAADRNVFEGIHESEKFVGDFQEKLTELFATIKNRLWVIFHEIEDESLVYTVFEVLNSRGLDVTWFDKLKSLLMAIVFEYGDAGSKKETIAELHKLWTDIYTTIGLRQSLNRETVRFAGTLRADKSPNRPLAEERSVDVLEKGCNKSAKKVVDCTKWLLRVTQAEGKLLGNHRLRGVTYIVQARLVAIAILIRDFPIAEEERLLKEWENTTFRIYGLGRRDSRTKVGDFVRLAWQIANENLSADEIVEELVTLSNGFQINKVLQKVRNRDYITVGLSNSDIFSSVTRSICQNKLDRC